MVELARIESAPLAAVVAEMLTTSDNNTAEMLVKEIGLVASGRGTRIDGLAAVAESLRRLGVPVDDLVLVDGSGLATGNRVRCSTLVGALGAADPAVTAGLPVLGTSGTLTGVMTDHPLAGSVVAKTGTLNNFPLDRDPPAVKAFARANGLNRIVLGGGQAPKLGIVAATGGICLVYLISLIGGFFGFPVPYIHSAGPIGIGFSLVVVVIAALNLVLDFDFIEQAAERGAPKYLEWYGAFALMVTLVWLYMEILRLISKLRSRD
jgi:hypothetical protein